MKRNTLAVVLMVLGSCFVSVGVLAHHGASRWDTDAWGTISAERDEPRRGMESQYVQAGRSGHDLRPSGKEERACGQRHEEPAAGKGHDAQRSSGNSRSSGILTPRADIR